MEKQIFKNIVSEETLKEAYAHHSRLREEKLKDWYVTLDQFEDLYYETTQNGFPFRKRLRELNLKILGYSEYNFVWKNTTPDDRTKIYIAIQEEYLNSEFCPQEVKDNY